jgi:hypothetical protein
MVVLPFAFFGAWSFFNWLVCFFIKLEWLRRFPARPSSGFHGKSDFDGHLPMVQLSLVNISARFDHLEPGQVLDRFVRAFNGFINGVLDGARRGAGEFDEFINVVFHAIMFAAASRLRYAIRRPLVIGETPHRWTWR